MDKSPKSTDGRSRISARAIVVSYSDSPSTVPLLDGIDLCIVPGELVAVVGPNGSGKSTLLRALSRTLKPKRGKVLLDDRDLYADLDARAAAMKIGVVSQETHIAFDFTVYEVVAMGRHPHSSPKALFPRHTSADLAAIRQAMDRAQIPAELLGRSVLSLSGGERQRVLIARALAQEANVLIFDEPTASLDIRHQTALLETLKHLAHEEGRAVLCAVHDLNLAAAHADRILLLKEGRIHAQGAPGQTLTPEAIREVYGANVWVRRHPATGRPYVLSMPQPFGDSEGPQGSKLPLASKRVHVLCGGGTGAALMIWLVSQGANVSAGALNLADTDQEAATILGVPHVVVAPFSAIGPEQAQAAAALAADADLVVLAEAPIGDGNLATLTAACDFAMAGATVLMVQTKENESFADRDFTAGKEASAIWEKLLVLPGVRTVSDPAAAIEELAASQMT